MDIPSTWWETFFDAVAADMWVNAVPPAHTEREADAIVRALGANVGAELLDVPCGAGRLALALARRGFRVTGVDLSPEFLARARAADPAARIDWELRDMRDLPWRARFDGAFCFGNSFGYLDDDGNAMFLRAVASALKPGGRLVLDTPMVLETLLRSITDRLWAKAGDVYLLAENRYDPERGRLDIDYTFVSGGRVDVRRGTHRAYTYRQLVELLQSAGFVVETAEPWMKLREAKTVTFVARRSG